MSYIERCLKLEIRCLEVRSMVFEVIIIIIAAFAAAFIAAISIPVGLFLRYDRGDLSVSAKWGLLSIRFADTGKVVCFAGRKIAVIKEKPRKEKVKKRKIDRKPKKEIERADKKDKGGSAAVIAGNLDLILILIRETLSMTRRMAKGIEIKTLRVEIRSLPVDPAFAGMGYGFYYGFIQPYLPSRSRIVYDPLNKMDANNYLNIAIKFHLYGLIFAILVFLIRIPKLKTYRFVKSL